ncbi:MAG TPA: N-acetylmuramic acid 6-phosphate etherase [Thermoanaerobaculia bacterium]|nr:N-acetylmuramic acid 6-phosphate etherase [Thermoanaerobaculia bacterium]
MSQSDAERNAQSTAESAAGWGELPTERRHPGTLDLDSLPVERVVELVLEEDRRGLDAVLALRVEIARVADWVAETLAGGGDVVLAGAGTSGRLAVLEAAECPPTFGTEPQRIRAALAGGEEAVFRAREGAEDRQDEGRRVGDGLRTGDLCIGLSASSVTPFTRAALDGARARGARTVLLTCAAAGRDLDATATLVIALDTGPEVLAGSTRLKAGSATKAALNAITTAAMVRLGKVYQNLMVDLRPGSAKLRDRSLRIISAAAGVPLDQARRLHEEAGGEVKTAIVMALARCDAELARRRLADAGGHVRAALEAAPPRAPKVPVPGRTGEAL